MKTDRKELERRFAQFQARLRDAGVKLTHQRLEIFREVAGSLEHPDAETILKAIQPRMPTMSLDTVYRTLWLLNDLGLVNTLGPRRQSARFDANVANHHHYVCENCGLARDFESTQWDELRIPASARVFGTIVRTQVEVRGICKKCARKSGGHPPPANRKQPKRRSKT
jgi:Fur family transcriptional regulator, peroxide stress response regulator